MKRLRQYIGSDEAEEFESRDDMRLDVIYVDLWFPFEEAERPHTVDVYYTPDGEGKVFVDDDEAYHLSTEEQVQRLMDDTGIEQVIERTIVRRKGALD